MLGMQEETWKKRLQNFSKMSITLDSPRFNDNDV